MIKRHIHMLLVLTIATIAGQASAVCEPQWLPGDAVPGIDGTVKTLISWDADGPGGQPALVIVGGRFSLAGNVPANNLACWDPATQTWSAFGLGVNNWVYSLAILDGKLYAGGYFTLADGANAAAVACWDPATQTWSALGTGLSTGTTGSYPSVTALAALDGKLYVAGTFATAGGVSASRIACWDPATATWSALGAGLTGAASAMAVLDGKLYVGLDGVSIWDPATSTWSMLGTRITGEYPALYALAVLDGKLYAAGDFTGIGGVTANHLACWDPATQTWSAVGSEVLPIQALAVGEGKLFALHVACYDAIGSWDPAGATWSNFAPAPIGATAYAAGALAFIDCKLYVGSDFTSTGGLAAAGIACLDPISLSWSALTSGIDNIALAMADLDGKVYVAGKFTSAGGVAANHIACLDPVTSTWSPLGIGTDGDHPEVNALLGLDGRLYAGGAFTSVDGLPANRIACWDPTSYSWDALGAGIDGPYPEVAALATLDGKLYVGGSFTTAGGLSADNIARWDPATATWSALGTGVDSRVNALTVLDGKLYAGGFFATAGGATAAGIACWDPTTQTWSAVGTGLDTGDVYVSPFVKALAALGGRLYVAGDFTTAGGASASRIACWDPAMSQWSALGAGMSEDMHALATLNGKLYVAGWFETAGGTSANSIAQWDPLAETWTPLGIGMDEAVYALAAIDDTLYAGGLFATADVEVSPYLARGLTYCPEPCITAAASRKSHGTAGSFAMNVTGVSSIESRVGGPTTVAVTFDRSIQRLGATLDDVQVSQGSVTSLAINGSTLEIGLSGAAAPQAISLTFPGIASADTGMAATEALCFRVLPGDASGDGVVDTSDYIAVRGRIGDPVTNANCRYDITTDGSINTSDYIAIRGRIGTSAAACP